MIEHNTSTPDIETSNLDYASRFRGPIGEYLLRVQEDAILRLVRSSRAPGPLTVIEVGGGHGQLTPMFLNQGCRVWVQGSDVSCGSRIEPLLREQSDRLQFVVSNLWKLPFGDRSFDVVVAIRLLSHVTDWRLLLQEMARVCKSRLIVDFPPILSANVFEPVLFSLKRRVEGNTRPYFCYTKRSLEGVLRSAGFVSFHYRKQFFAPMVVHRILGRPQLSRKFEQCASSCGLTALLGAPSVLLACR